MLELEEIMQELDSWVSQHGDGCYVDPGFEPKLDYSVPADSGIQQERREIEAFVAKLLEIKHRGTALEIGLGQFGSTHFLWRLLFDRVITIESNHDRVRTFGRNMREHYNKWMLDDGHSSFLIGMSYQPATIAKAYKLRDEPFDLLFIDGDHSYNSVLTDWLIYQGTVRTGGIVAFHDSAVSVPGIYNAPEFLENLREGRIDGNKRQTNDILFSKNLGISWYCQE